MTTTTHTCKLCGEKKKISPFLGICVACLRNTSYEDENIKQYIQDKHATARKGFPVPAYRPNTEPGIQCTRCASECIIPEGGFGWCGLRGNNNGRFIHKAEPNGKLSFYLDALPTNCCNSWFCPAGTGAGFPQYAKNDGPEYGSYNLALFMYGCSFNCLFCQNWHHKSLHQGSHVSKDKLVETALSDKRITCLCWFGGSPEPQLPFILEVSQRILDRKDPDRIIRFCFEWNGSARPNLVKKAAELAYRSGGNIKFDFKAFHPQLHFALTGMDNQRVKDNIKLVYDNFWDVRSDINPILGITTLLVPYYVDAQEIKQIAKFLASLDADIPYSLLVFHPDFMLSNLPITPKKQVKKAKRAAEEFLNQIHIGNLHLIGSL